MYDVNLNYFSIISGETSFASPIYMEAKDDANKNTPKGAQYLKNFLLNIEDIADTNAVKDKRISSSKGNIKNFQGYKNITTVLSFLRKNLGKISGVDDCDKIFTALERFAPQYQDCYDKQIRLGILEYESALYLLITSLAMFMSTKVEFVANGEEIRIQKKSEATNGMIEKTTHEFAVILSKSNHKDYLEELVKATQEASKSKPLGEGVTYLESVVGDTLDLIDAIGTHSMQIVKGVSSIFNMLKDTVFGVVPLIRSAVYLKYKKRADTILALEDQADFIEKNIEQLQNRTNMDPKKKEMIIRKQTAAMEGRRKKAAKLRAQLLATEKEASEEIKKDTPKIQNTEKKPTKMPDSSPKKKEDEDDDLVLENGIDPSVNF